MIVLTLKSGFMIQSLPYLKTKTSLTIRRVIRFPKFSHL